MENETVSKNFIEQMIDKDIEEGYCHEVHTRFPPEPNGYLQPENVEVYLDGNYVGISPCSFKKTSGSHVITLRKSGYETRSYTVQVDDEQKDVSYSFVDLTVSSQTSK